MNNLKGRIAPKGENCLPQASTLCLKERLPHQGVGWAVFLDGLAWPHEDTDNWRSTMAQSGWPDRESITTQYVWFGIAAMLGTRIQGEGICPDGFSSALSVGFLASKGPLAPSHFCEVFSQDPLSLPGPPRL